MKGRNFRMPQLRSSKMKGSAPMGKSAITKEYWQRILASPHEAKLALASLATPTEAVTTIRLEDGTLVNVKTATEKQAHEIMCALCPAWAKLGLGEP